MLLLICLLAMGIRGLDSYREPPSLFLRPKPLLSYNPLLYGYNLTYNGPIPKDEIINAIAYASDYGRNHFENDKGLGRGEDDPSYWGNGVAAEVYLPQLKDYADAGFFLSKVSEYLVKEFGYRPESSYGGGGLKLIEYSEYLPEKYGRICKGFYRKCFVSKYRTIDGSCNNLQFPFYGQANTILGRIAIPKFGDGIHSIRMGVDGSPLPSPRSLRVHALPDKNVDEPSVNMMFVNLGQFLTHDLVHTPFYQGEDGLFLDCCHGFKGGHEQVHPKCLALSISNDPFYKERTNEECLNFARAILAPNYACAAGYSNPLNYQTSHLDLSLVYGRGYNDSLHLRLGKDGLLRMDRVGDQFYLPLDSKAECFNSSGELCFKSGDLRTTIHPGVSLLQTLSSRFHNAVARKLIRLNPHWDDERIFQESRRINIAVNQHITYTEYLPILLGWRLMSKHGILPPSYGYSDDYDERVKPWIYAEFSGSAFRLHTSVYGKILLATDSYQVESQVPLQQHYNSAALYREPKNFGKLLRGYLLTPMRKHDKYYDPALSEYLLMDTRAFGLDIGAFNIQRGRDYGLPPYTTYREICGLPKANSWNDLLDVFDPETLSEFRQLYRHWDDIDLYTGGIAEKHLPGTLLGPTHACIVAFQFQKLKQSDRFFYSIGNQPNSFSSAQLTEIRKMTMLSVICMTSDLFNVPTFAFHTISPGNPLVSCIDEETVPRIDFGPWKIHTKYEL